MRTEKDPQMTFLRQLYEETILDHNRYPRQLPEGS
jgi:hypothetical protein